MYVADEDNHTVRMVTPHGIVSTLGGSPGSPALRMASAVQPFRRTERVLR